jgi:hypothetical protein
MPVAIKNLTGTRGYGLRKGALPRNAVIHQDSLRPLQLNESREQDGPSKEHKATDEYRSTMKPSNTGLIRF